MRLAMSGQSTASVKSANSNPGPTVQPPSVYAPVDRIEPYGESGKHRVVFSEPARPIDPIPFADAPSGAMQGPRYTSFERLKSARKLTDLVGPVRH